MYDDTLVTQQNLQTFGHLLTMVTRESQKNHMAVGEHGIIAANVKSAINIYSVHIE